MDRNRTVVVTGATSGIGQAVRQVFEASGATVLSVSRSGADIRCDLAAGDGRALAAAAIAEATGGVLDALVTCAGMPGTATGDGSLVVGLDYFGSVGLIGALRPLLARGTDPAVVAVGSTSSTLQPDIPHDLVAACLDGTEEEALALGAEIGALDAYAPAKLALTHWVRRTAPTPEWAGVPIRLNAVAPGPVDTPMLATVRADPVIGELVDALPIPLALPTAAQVADVVEFLASPRAAVLCGAVVVADGGTEALVRPDLPTPMGWSRRDAVAAGGA